MFLFAVGVYGATKREVTRHLALWGLIPLDWVYLALLVGGACLLLLYSPNSPFYVHGNPAADTPAGAVWRAIRGAISLVLLAAAIAYAALH